MHLKTGQPAIESNQSLYAVAPLGVAWRRDLQKQFVGVCRFLIIFGARRSARIGHKVIRLIRVEANGYERFGARLIDAALEIIQFGGVAVSERLFGIEAQRFSEFRHSSM